MPTEHKEERLALRNDIVAVLKAKVEEELVIFLNRSASFKELAEAKRYVAFKGVLFQSTANWDSALRKAVDDIIAKVLNKDHAHANLYAFVKLWFTAVEYRAEDISAEGAKAMLQDSVLLKTIWNALQSGELLPPGIYELLGIRDSFIKAGATAEDMPLNKQLEGHLPAYESSQSR